MTLLGTLRARGLGPELDRYAATYDAPDSMIDALQLQRFNAAWSESLKRSPWARALRQHLSAPKVFDDWETFNRIIPIQRKSDLRTVLDGPEPPKDVLWRSTGGTTAEPVRVPIFPCEAKTASVDIWLARRRLGIRPQDKLFLLWGHSHLFGTGLKGAMARVYRTASDWALGYTRWSAYRLSPSDLSLAAKALTNSGARYVLGYSSALERFARNNIEYAPAIRRLGLRAVIATAESFPAPDSRDVVSEFFGCPVVMEYGTVETGPIAYECAAGGYDVFWPHHRLEQVASSETTGARELVVTCLFPRALPLLRYAVGDMIETEPENGDCRKAFKAVIGRCNDIVTTTDGTPIHSESFTHAVRDIAGIQTYQIVRNQSHGAVCLKYEAEKPLSSEAVTEIRRRLSIIDAEFANFPVERTRKIEKSIAGKTIMVVEEP